MSAVITPERPDTADARALIEELDAYLTPIYPAESQHGGSVETLIAEGVAFFVLRCDGALVGCGGVQFHGTEYGEIKRMYVRPEYRGRGFGELMLHHLADYTLGQGVSLLRLETGVYQDAAIALYERAGFRRVPPFGSYGEDPLSVFYEKQLGDSEG